MINTELLVLFPTVISSSSLPGVDHTALISLAYHIRDSRPWITDWNSPTYNTREVWDWHTEPTTAVQDLVAKATARADSMAQELGDVDPEYSLKCQALWFNIARPGDYQEHHVHHGANFSAVYYLTVPAASGNIVFTRPGWAASLPMPIQDRPGGEFRQSVNYEIAPQAGQLLIFPSSLEHQVRQNSSSLDRVCVSMNFKFARREPPRV